MPSFEDSLFRRPERFLLEKFTGSDGRERLKAYSEDVDLGGCWMIVVKSDVQYPKGIDRLLNSELKNVPMLWVPDSAGWIAMKGAGRRGVAVIDRFLTWLFSDVC